MTVDAKNNFPRGVAPRLSNLQMWKVLGPLVSIGELVFLFIKVSRVSCETLMLWVFEAEEAQRW